MKYRYIFILLIVPFIISCSDDPTRIRNKKIIDKDTFKEVLIDIHMMDAITNSPSYFRKFNQKDSVDIYSGIFKKHGVTKALFDSTVSAYSRQPEVYKAIYDEVLLTLNRRLNELKDQQGTDEDKPKDPREILPDQ